MRLSALQISMGLSLLIHGAIFGAVYMGRHSNTNVTESSESDTAEIIEILVEPEATVASQPLPVMEKAINPAPVQVVSKPALAALAVEPQVEKKEPVQKDLEDDRALLQELQEMSLLQTDNEAQPVAPAPVTAVSTTNASRCEVSCVGSAKPVYPRAARQQREEGLVVLTLTVTQSGQTEGVRVCQSSGYQLLDEAALEAVRQWKFNPARVGQIAVATSVEVPVRFKLSD